MTLNLLLLVSSFTRKIMDDIFISHNLFFVSIPILYAIFDIIIFVGYGFIIGTWTRSLFGFLGFVCGGVWGSVIVGLVCSMNVNDEHLFSF